MALGDLTSGINMLPNDSINQGFRSMASDLGAIEQAKSAEAQNKIKQFNDLANVSLKGLQANAMDEGVAARDAMIKQLAKWEAEDGSTGLTWEHQKQAQAMKANLENMVTMSQENQKLATQAVQTALKIKDPKAQAKYLNNYKQIMNGKSIAEINQGLHNLSVPPVQTSLTKVVSLFPLPSKNRNYFNYNSTVDFYRKNGDNYYVKGYIDNLINKGIVKTPEEGYNFIAKAVQDKTVTMPTAGQINAAKDKKNHLPWEYTDANHDSVNLTGVKKGTDFGTIGVIKDGKKKQFQHSRLVRVMKVDGKWVGLVAYSNNNAAIININGNNVTNESLETAKKTGDMSALLGGKKGEVGFKEIPANQLKNYVIQNHINLDNTPELKDAVFNDSNTDPVKQKALDIINNGLKK